MRKTTDTGLMHREVCPFTPQLSLVLINRPRGEGGGWHAELTLVHSSHGRDLNPSPALYHSATAHLRPRPSTLKCPRSQGLSSNAPWFSSETLALYKSLTYLLTYLLSGVQRQLLSNLWHLILVHWSGNATAVICPGCWL